MQLRVLSLRWYDAPSRRMTIRSRHPMPNYLVKTRASFERKRRMTSSSVFGWVRDSQT